MLIETIILKISAFNLCRKENRQFSYVLMETD
jgi:hypothetical protein